MQRITIRVYGWDYVQHRLRREISRPLRQRLFTEYVNTRLFPLLGEYYRRVFSVGGVVMKWKGKKRLFVAKPGAKVPAVAGPPLRETRALEYSLVVPRGMKYSYRLVNPSMMEARYGTTRPYARVHEFYAPYAITRPRKRFIYPVRRTKLRWWDEAGRVHFAFKTRAVRKLIPQRIFLLLAMREREIIAYDMVKWIIERIRRG